MGEPHLSLGLPTSTWPLVRLYILRILIRLGGYRYVMDERRVLEPDLFAELGVPCPSPGVAYRPDLLLLRLRNRLRSCERRSPALPDDIPLAANLHWLKQILELSPVESAIIQFLALAHHASSIRELLEKFRTLRIHEIFSSLAMVLNHPADEISEALSHTSKLVRSGLLWVDISSQWSPNQKVGFLAGVAEQLPLLHADPFSLFLSNFRRSSPGSLNIQDFSHLETDLQILLPYLRDTIQARRKGVNVLIVGPPGTGKTELVHTLAEELGSPLFEIATEDRNGHIHDGPARLGAFQLAQGLLGGDPRPILLFDEVEDIFCPHRPDLPGDIGPVTTSRKAWVNQQLEENPVPTFWVTNATSGWDLAFIRRFDFVLHLEVPPRSVRLRILEHHAQGLPLSPTWMRSMAEHEQLTPAAIERAAKVTRAVSGSETGLQVETIMSTVLGNALEEMGASRLPRHASPSAVPYRLDVLNADRDLNTVLEGVRHAGSVRMALYGPPGSGKTAFARHLSEVLDRPLIVKRASDLQSMWVGQTEKALARMFAEAMEENAVLLLDEADSFLADRRGAQRSWEVSQVNELLTQMESFSGVFIGCTNRMENLDEAALRRFDLKVRFDYMNADQRRALLLDCMDLLGLPQNPEAVHLVSSLPRLTPGDFNTVMRQGRLDPILSASVFVERLAQECRVKSGGSKRPVGFQ